MIKEKETTIDGLTQFLVKAKKEGYASGDNTTIKEEDGSYSTRYEDGDFKFHDNWFGGEPFGGREVVFYKEKPIWIMTYYGEEFLNDGESIKILRKALSDMPEEFPVRGPKQFIDGEFKYENLWEGNLNKFHGGEHIFIGEKQTYHARYAGGNVNK
jgi:hypothetical protein